MARAKSRVRMEFPKMRRFNQRISGEPKDLYRGNWHVYEWSSEELIIFNATFLHRKLPGRKILVPILLDSPWKFFDMQFKKKPEQISN